MVLYTNASQKKSGKTERPPVEKKGTPACGGSSFSSINDIHRNLGAGALGIGTHHSADLLGDAALTADDLTHVLRGHTQLQRQPRWASPGR